MNRLMRGGALAGVVAGGVAPFAASFSPTFGPGATTLATGVVMNNDTLQTMGGFALGASLVRGAQIPGAALGNGGFL